MRKRIVGVGLILGWAAWALSGCGGGSPKPQTTLPSGTVIILIGDSPACDVLAFRPTISKLTFTPQGGGTEVPVIQSTTSFVPAIKVNFAGMRDSETVLATATVGAISFEAATLTLTSPVLTVFDPTQTNLFNTLTVNMTTSTPKGAIVPPLQVKGTTVSVLRLDFDLLQSIGVDALGQATGTVTPTFRGTAVTASPGNGPLAEVNGLRGFVERVDTVGQNSSFTGAILVEVLEGSGASILVNLVGGTNPTKLIGVAALNQIPTGSYVEVEGFIDSKGNFVANTIEVEDREAVDENKLAFIGYVTSVTKDASGNLTQFNFYVHEEEPDSGFLVPLDTVVAVNVSSSTGYQFSSPSANFANLSFGPAAIVSGLELVVHGTFTVPPRPASATVAADKIYLKLQTVQGSFSSPLQTGSDDKTGAFYLASCPGLLRGVPGLIKGVPVLVVTNNQTAFVNVVGLNELTPRATLLVKGLPFFEAQATTVNGVAVPAGTLVLLAQAVHQLS